MSTYGVTPELQRSVVLNTTAYVQAAQARDVTARSITSRRATAKDTAKAAITTPTRTLPTTAVLRCSATRIMQK